VSVPTDPEQNPPAAEPAPLPRIGDAERDRAVGYLQEHMAQGRLDSVEFDDRLTRALSARTEADLQPLFEDLPEPRPSTGLATTAPYVPPPWASSTPVQGASVVPASQEGAVAHQAHMPRGAVIVLAAVWPAAIILSFALGFENWWIWIAAAMISYFVRRAFTPDQPPDDQPGPRPLGR
jgi:hypothetical protein